MIDLAFGPDEKLYVVEYDQDGWLAALSGNAAGGTINRCDVGTLTCSVVAGGLVLPGAITFDKWGHLWIVENNIVVPTVHRVDLPWPSRAMAGTGEPPGLESAAARRFIR